MKLTKSKLKQLIKEALLDLEEGWGEERRELDTAKVGDYVEIEISDDGYDKSIELIDPKEFKPSLGNYTSVKLLAKIESVAGREWEDDDPGEPSEDPELTPQQQSQSDALAFKPGPA